MSLGNVGKKHRSQNRQATAKNGNDHWTIRKSR